MSTTITRRHVLKLAGGSALGFFFTPMPWKLLDDLSIWTQNWGLIPPLPRGPVTTVATACPLCASGCAVEASLIRGVAFQLAGRGNNLCPYGLSGYQLAAHPARLRTAAAAITPAGSVEPYASAETVLDAVATILRDQARGPSGAGTAYITSRPESLTADIVTQLFRNVQGARVCTPASYEGKFFAAANNMLPPEHPALGVDFERVSTLLSIGAPVLEGWGQSHDILRALRANRCRTRIIEASPVRTASGIFGNDRLPLRPGTELAFVLALTRLVVDEGLHSMGHEFADVAEKLRSSAIDEIVVQTGLTAERVINTARALANHPSLVLTSDLANGSVQLAVWQLNALLGAFGPEGCLVARRRMRGSGARSVTELEALDDGSLGLVIIDPSVTSLALPGDLLRRKLNGTHAAVVRLGAFVDPVSLASTHLIRVAAPYERLDEVRSHPTGVESSFALSLPIHTAAADSPTPAEVMCRIAERAGIGGQPITDQTGLLKQAVDRIHASRAGVVVRAADDRQRVDSMASSEELWDALEKGGRWIDRSSGRGASGQVRFVLDENMERILRHRRAEPDDAEEESLTAVLVGLDAAASFPIVSPALSKIYQESILKPVATRAVVHPDTARARGLADGEDALFVVQHHEVRAFIRIDSGIAPGIVAFTQSPFGLPDEVRVDRPGLQHLAARQFEGTTPIMGNLQS